jgi:MFS family permease
LDYIRELRANWRPILAATIGMSCGFTAMAFTNNIMGPHLIREFGWSKADYALLGTLGMMTLIALPLSGRLVDMFGVRRTALIGFIVGPIGFILMTRMTGDIRVFFALVLLQNLFCMTTTTTVFSRTVVQNVVRARGLALALAASGPALATAVLGPVLNNFVEANGWRAGYIALAIFSLTGGLVALALAPSQRAAVPVAFAPIRKATKAAYARIIRIPAFWIMLGGIITTNLSQFITTGQLNILLLDHGVTPKEISGMIAAFAIGVLIGRFVCGVALDRYNASIVTMVAMALPAFGLFLIASDLNSPFVLTVAILLLGLSYGAEGDVIAYIVSRTFAIEIYGTVLGLMAASISIGSTTGAILLSITLKSTGSYQIFLIVAGLFALFGSLLFLFLPNRPRGVVDDMPQETLLPEADRHADGGVPTIAAARG